MPFLRGLFPCVAILVALLTACQGEPTQPRPVAPPDGPSFHETTTEDGRTKIVYLSPADFQLLGNATAVTTPAGPAIRLTLNSTFQRGAAWLRTKQLLAPGFQAEFHFRIRPDGCFPADGLAFVLHNDPRGTLALGEAGGGMGYQNISRGLAVEFDTWDNNEYPDPNANHIGVMSSGLGLLSPSHATTTSLGFATPTQVLANTVQHRALIDYRPGSFDVFFDGGATPLIHLNTTLTSVRGVANLLDAEGKAWVGFTAATGGACESHFIDILPNQLPVANAGGPYAGQEGMPVTLSASLSEDADGDPLTFAWDTDGDGQFDDGTGESIQATFGDNGSYTVRVRVTDHHNGSSTDDAQVTVTNVAPTATVVAPAAVDEGSSIEFSLTAPVDVAADLASLTYAFDCTGTGGPAYGAWGTTTAISCPTSDNGSRDIKGKIRDKDGGETEYTATVTVNNVAPAVGPLTVPLDPVEAGTPVTVSAAYTDPGTGDTHAGSVQWDIGGGFETDGATAGGGAVSATSILPAGVYTVTLRVTDDDGASGTSTATAYIVVFDPSAGFVTGGGWIPSPAGAYAPDPAVSGKANFGFVAKYHRGASTPSGNTEFQFKAGGLHFKSTGYEWLVVAGSRAKFKGEGTIDGAGRYGFQLTALDGGPSGEADGFRIKIWDLAGGGVVYDNKMGEGDDSDASTALGGGSVTIHR